MSVLLNNIDDFISPSQECIKPVKSSRLPSNAPPSTTEKVSITLNDCLACSGCITSAESVLIEQQSFQKAISVLEMNNAAPAKEQKLIVASLSPQSIASLSVKIGFAYSDTQSKLAGFLRSVGVDIILDTTISREISLIETAKEFISKQKELLANNSKQKYPILTGICPGWVCYAEKSHGSYILPHVSKIRSPQQIMGAFVKSYIASTHNKSPGSIFHFAVMPCFDKKLEASRDAYLDPVTGALDVDCVISSAELVQMLEHYEKPLDSYHSDEFYPMFGIPYSPFTHSGGGSGGYLEYTFLQAASQLYGIESPELNYVMKRNSDMREVTLTVNGEPKLKFALAYGFRNIQNVVQKVKQGKCPYDFIEIMACPSGCLNGGGQIRPAEGQDNKELYTAVTESYNSVEHRPIGSSAVVKRLYKEWLINTEAIQKYVLTEYREVEKMTNALTIKW